MLVSYWDIGNCGPAGNDANWNICGHQNFNCPDTIDLDTCPDGIAFKLNEYGNGEWGSYVDENNCEYFYYTEYVCERPDPSTFVLHHVLVFV